MIVNNPNPQKFPQTIRFDQSGSDSDRSRGGTLPAGEYDAFSPVGDAPYTLKVNASPSFTVEGIQSPDALITFVPTDGDNPNYLLSDPGE